MRDDVDAIIDQWRTVRPDLDASPIGIVGRVSRLARGLEGRLGTGFKTPRPRARAPSPIGIVGRVSRLARELGVRLEPVYKAHGLEPGWHDVLATLRRSGPPFRLRVTDLTSSLMIGSSGTTKRLDRLEGNGLVA